MPRVEAGSSALSSNPDSPLSSLSFFCPSRRRLVPPLRSLLCSSALKPTVCKNSRCRLCQTTNDESTKQWGPRPRCNDKDIVYGVRCKLCDARYIGETKQPAADRFRQHFPSGKKADEDSSVAQHHYEQHPNQEPDFEMVVLGRGSGFTLRKCREAVLIDIEQPSINKVAEGSGAMDLHF